MEILKSYLIYVWLYIGMDVLNTMMQLNLESGVEFLPACSKATIMDCSIRSLSMKPRKSSRYTVRSGSWKVHRGVSRSGSLLLPPVLET